MSEARQAFARLTQANPLPVALVQELVEPSWREALLVRLLREPLPVSRRFIRPRTRVLLAGAAVLALAAVPSYAIGRSIVDWLAGEPAPPEIVKDFGQYAPQLGFNPKPGEAVLVARDQDLRLYVTTNSQGTYCYSLSTRRDGGTCVPRAVALTPIVAATVGTHPAGGFIVVGRIQNPLARSVRFAAPNGDAISREVGAGGFFVAGVLMDNETSACSAGDWAPSFSFFDHDGALVGRATIALAVGSRAACSFGSLHGP